MDNTNSNFDVINEMSDSELIEFMESLNDSEKAAFKIQMMLRGREIETPDDTDIIIEDEKPKKSKKSNSTGKIKAGNSFNEVPFKDQFSKLKDDLKIDVVLNGHMSTYQGGEYRVPERIIPYYISLVRQATNAGRLSDIFNGNSKMDRDRAKNGEVAYMSVKTYVEAVPSAVREVASIMITESNGKLYRKVIVNKQACKQNSIDTGMLSSKIYEALKTKGVQ